MVLKKSVGKKGGTTIIVRKTTTTYKIICSTGSMFSSDFLQPTRWGTMFLTLTSGLSNPPQKPLCWYDS